MKMFKIKFNQLTRTNLGTPSLFEGTLEDGRKVKFHFRYGRLKVFVDEKEVLETCKDEFDVSGYLSDEDLKMLMKKHELLDE